MAATTSFHLLEATVDDTQGAMRARQLSAVDLVKLYFARIDAYDHEGPELHAVENLNPLALREAERQDALLAEGKSAGPLHGIPVLVKDQVEAVDMPTTYGSAVFKHYTSSRDGTIVQRMKAAGAIILGKTTMGEFAQGYAGSAFGFCRNPYDPTRNPTGSSCGSGAGLAANFSMLSIGEDTGGSIRGPAAFNSLVGLRPTLPLVSRFGMMPANPTRDTLGPIARSVRDLAILLDAIAGYDPNDPVTAASYGHVPESYTSFLTEDGLRGMRIGVIREPMANDTKTDAEDFKQVRATIDRALGDLANQGAELVDPLEIPRLIELLRSFPAEQSFETEAAINGYLAELPDSPVKSFQELVLSPEVLAFRRVRLMSSVNRTTNDSGYLQELHNRQALRETVLKTMADYRLDALVYATFDHLPALIPDDILTRSANPSQPGNNRILAPLLQYPALSVQAGFTPEGLPVGLELLGRPFSEGTLIRIAYSYEQATKHRRPPTLTPALAGEP